MNPAKRFGGALCRICRSGTAQFTTVPEQYTDTLPMLKMPCRPRRKRPAEPPDGAAVRSRTSNLLIRSQMLYPIELRLHFPIWDAQESTCARGWQLFLAPMCVVSVFRPKPLLRRRTAPLISAGPAAESCQLGKHRLRHRPRKPRGVHRTIQRTTFFVLGYLIQTKVHGRNSGPVLVALPRQHSHSLDRKSVLAGAVKVRFGRTKLAASLEHQKRSGGNKKPAFHATMLMLNLGIGANL